MTVLTSLPADCIVNIINDWFDSNAGRLDGTTPPSSEDMEGLSKAIVMAARLASMDKSVESPFAVQAKDYDIIWNNGGKPDDTVVIISMVT